MHENESPNSRRALRLADAMNTFNRALSVVRSKGYQIYYMPDDREDYGDFWAILNQRDFIAADPLRLLGLIALWEHFGDEWQAKAVPDIYDEVLRQAFPEEEYTSLGDDEFTLLVKHLRPFFEAIGKPLPPTVSRSELFGLMNNYYRSEE